VLRYITSKQQSEDILAVYMKNVFVRDDLLEAVKNSLQIAVIMGLETHEVRDRFSDFIIRVVNTPVVRQGVMSSFVYNPIKSFFSFGEQTSESKGEELA